MARPIEIEVGEPVDSDPAVAAASPPPPPRRPAQRFGRYELRHLLASGGMASVHLAVTRGTAGFQKVFALKRIHPHLASDADFVHMFLDEARLASRIDHPNVCSVFDFGEVDGEHFMAMELLLGEPYGKVLGRMARLPRAERERARAAAVNLIADACEGLHAAHELRTPGGVPLNVVHRDISPHNLVVTYNGVIKVVDFGVARAAEQLHQTTTGTVKGKFGYMAPEQMRGNPVDRRADVWSLGVVLWESLVYRTLFRRATQSETVLAVMAGNVPSLRDFDPAVDPELDALVRRAVSVDPDERFPTARAMGRALRKWATEHAEVMDAADLADWMRRIFPQAAAAKRALVRQALEAPSAELAPAEPGAEPGHPSHSTVVGKSFARGERTGGRRRWVLPLLLTGLAGAAVVGLGGVVKVDPVTGTGTGTETGTGTGTDLQTAAQYPASEASPTSSESEASRGVRRAEKRSGRDERTDARRTGSPRWRGEPSEKWLGARGDEREANGVGGLDLAGSRSEPPSSAPAAPSKRARLARARARAARAARAAARSPGTVNVAARGGWANVYEGHRLLGPTPGSYQLPAGRHVLVFRGDDGKVLAHEAVQVTADGTARLVVDLAH